jgi:hypothetical protein
MSEGLMVGWRRVSPAARLAALADLEARIAGLHAEQLALLAVIDADPVTVSLDGSTDKRWAVEDVACVLRLSPGVARARLGEASEAARLPGVLELLGAGQISAGHVRVLTEATMGLDVATAAAVTGRVLTRAPEQAVGPFRAAVRRAVLTVTAASTEEQRRANVADRRVCLRPAGEGTSELWALLPTEGATALISAVNALAQRPSPQDERSADQRRADALVQLGLDALAGEHSHTLPRAQRLRPAVQVSVALSTLLELDEQPAELSGTATPPTPISAALARRLAGDPSGTWRRILTDPHGRLLDYGRSTYRPPAELTRHIQARDRTCRFPHCTRTAQHCDLDHTTAWADGGTTTDTNLLTLCPRHHHLRHDTAWTYTRHADDTVTWTTPTGHTHTRPPDPYPIDTTTTTQPNNVTPTPANPTDAQATGHDPPPL